MSHGPSPSEAAPQTDQPGPGTAANLWERRLAATGRLREKPLEDAASRRGRRSHGWGLAPSKEFDSFVKITVAQGTLNPAPMLMPNCDTAVRRALDIWFRRIGVGPRVLVEFEDRVLMKAFGKAGAGAGVSSAPTAVQDDVVAKYGAAVIGRTEEVKERFCAISGMARSTLFG